MQNAVGEFNGTDWRSLEFALEVIGDTIAYWINQLKLENEKVSPSKETLAKIETTVLQLGTERLQCYNSKFNHTVITKAYTVYAPFLKSIREAEKVRYSGNLK